MKFAKYLEKSREIAKEERDVLDEISKKSDLNKIEIRAAKSALQTMIENAIGKAKRVLKYYDCPVVPARSKDAIFFMFDIGLIDDETYANLTKAVGFRNSMIHDYMDFNEDILKNIVKERFYMQIFNFLTEEPNYTNVQLSRIKNYTV